MKKTGLLTVLGDSTLEMGKVVIHPNDGFELDLFQYSYPILLYHGMTVEEFNKGGGENVPGEIILSNDCKMGRVELPQKLCARLNNPNKAILIYSDGRLLLATN
ncbi:MAG: hypothetical protein JEY99_12250 [Spirochaetales bacterium]|nr:hypothetical protein [Spirochaetales bacterium]